MTAHDTKIMGAEALSPPRAVGSARIGAARPGRLADLRQSGSLKVLFPRTQTKALDAVLLNTAGGITGGDNFDVRAEARECAHLTLTTQAAERAYAAQPGQTGKVETRLKVGDGARIDWLPQETILFDRAALRRRLTVDLAAEATCLLVEPIILGRAAMGEAVSDLAFDDRISIRRDGVPVFLDATRLSGAAQSHMDQTHIGQGARAMAIVVFAAPTAEAHLDAVRGMLPATGGASLIGDTLLVVRLLAPDGYDLRRNLIPILTRLHGTDLPRPWML